MTDRPSRVSVLACRAGTGGPPALAKGFTHAAHSLITAGRGEGRGQSQREAAKTTPIATFGVHGRPAAPPSRRSFGGAVLTASLARRRRTYSFHPLKARARPEPPAPRPSPARHRRFLVRGETEPPPPLTPRGEGLSLSVPSHCPSAPAR